MNRITRQNADDVALALLGSLPATKALKALETSPIVDGVAGGRATTGADPMTEVEIDAWTADALAASDLTLDAFFSPARIRKPKTDDGLGRRITYAAGLRFGTVLVAPHGVPRFGGSSVSPGSLCSVTNATPDHLYVRFEDAETGEVLEGDVDPAALRFPVATPTREAA